MMTIRSWVMAAALLAAAACAPLPLARQPQEQALNLSGKWVLTTESRMGAQDAEMTLQQTGKAFSGILSSETGNVPYAGVVQGDDVAFSFTIKAQGTDLKVDYSGKVVGDTMQGKAVIGRFGEGRFTARRKST